MIIEVTADGWLSFDGQRMRCALGRAGMTSNKREGDGATPRGDFPLRRVLFRQDRVSPPKTTLQVAPIGRDDGWCDEPGDPLYNQPVTLPYEASCESLWRDDRLYDMIVVLGHNDDPVVAGGGSAIFLHVAEGDYGPTEGCVAVAVDDLVGIVETSDNSTILRIS